ncbi:MAG: hypothetical protein ACKVIW_15350, partial [bacterium]
MLQMIRPLWAGGMSVFRTLLMAVAFGIANALPMMAGSLRALAKAKAGTGTEKAEDTRVGL